MKPLLLDTHVWLWFALANRNRLNREAIQAIQEAARQRRLRISIMSVWEIGLLESKSRVRLDMTLDDWIDQALALPGLEIVSLNPRIALDCNHLPDDFHADPADRIIVATARHLTATLMTADRKIIAYGQKGHVRTWDL